MIDVMDVVENQGISNTQESFQLEPLDQAALQQEKAAAQAGRPKRKRKLMIIDEVKCISGEQMKANMNDYR